MYGVIVSESSMNKYNIFADLYALKLNIAVKVLKLPAIAGSRQLFRTLHKLILDTVLYMQYQQPNKGKINIILNPIEPIYSCPNFFSPVK